jgi:hypothetical protein
MEEQMPQGVFRIWGDPNQVRVLYEDHGVAIVLEETYRELHLSPELDELPWREKLENAEAGDKPIVSRRRLDWT